MSAGKARLALLAPLVVMGAPIVARGMDVYFHGAFPSWWVLGPAVVLVAGLVGQDLLTDIGADTRNSGRDVQIVRRNRLAGGTRPRRSLPGSEYHVPMTERVNNDASRRTPGASEFKLAPLTPEYREQDHGDYVRYLEEALSQSPKATILERRPRFTKAGREDLAEKIRADQTQALRSPKNIALTGSYGIGKSSILQEVKRRLPERVVTLSLSTLGSEAAVPNDSEASDESGKVVTNDIQKEIVKQLLYREIPSKVPGSRYRRIEPFRHSKAMTAALLIAIALTLLGFLTGATERLSKLVGDGWAVAWLHVILTVGFFGLSYWALKLLHNRVWIKEVKSGPASIALTDTNNSYFDEYLDEIVYFFQVTRCDIAIFEDLDRFKDPHIFETLRELNTILNNSKQLPEIRFVYALRDSIFDQLAKDTEDNAADDRDRRNLALTNRTKFFDLVIPVVPFITHRSSRDLMSQIVNESDKISPKLINLAAKHIVDMRLMRNIHNEFTVFKRKILDVEGGIKELTPDGLFAMTLYKNRHLSDFEKIKDGRSVLDELYADHRLIITQGIQNLDRDIRAVKARETKPNLDSRSDDFGTRLEGYAHGIVKAFPQFQGVASYAMGRKAITTEMLHKFAFWEEFLGETKPVLTVRMRSGNELTFAASDISRVSGAFNRPLSIDGWRDADVAQMQQELASLEEEKRGLLQSDMERLIAYPQYCLDGEQPRSFAAIAQEKLSPLAYELLEAGYINQNFTLYVSKYYDVHVSATAMNFIIHTVQNHTTNPTYRFQKPEDIESVLAEEGKGSLYEEPWMYNIQIFDHLLPDHDVRITPAIRKLAGSNKEFLQTYISNGKETFQLFRRLSAHWPGIFAFVATDPGISEDKRPALFNAALYGVSPETKYNAGEHVKTFVHDHYDQLSALTNLGDPRTANTLGDTLAGFAIKLPSLKSLSGLMRTQIIARNLYELTETNIRDALPEGTNLALDSIETTSPAMFSYLLDNLEQYLDIIEAGKDPSILDPGSFIRLLEMAADRDETAPLARLVKNAAPDCRAERLADIENQLIWPALALDLRFPTTYQNIQSYIMAQEGIDSALAVLLEAQPEILWADDEGIERDLVDPEVLDLAVAVLNRHDISARARVKIVQSLQLEESSQVPAGSLEPEEGDLFSLLLENGIIEDSAASYEQIEALSWQTKEGYIRRSKDFAEYLPSLVISDADLISIVEGSSVPAAVKAAIVEQLPNTAFLASASALSTIAEYALDAKVKLPTASLQRLADGNVQPMLVIKLMAPVLEDLTKAELIGILEGLGGDHGKLATLGGSVRLPDTDEYRALFQKLHEFDLVSTWPAIEGTNAVRVNMRKQKS